ncbi:DUF222 domain-containing protein [Corynebacterium sp. zg254]|uniref:DUF222 domain-containing protein n=1 Tax=Corynebacterium zhongnanshanii TaxID=2768834 RepID=A0ABQ6VCT0_9CORY|nr:MULTISPECIES: HNH endonuclease signature motif containing protein [Corynebacterium]KAB3519893.1 DUF222 domain-containing protein [Corynebacterium zhongnanshanii]MCR5914838.1 DUF222 domain-containing protein [Corynebacterium sp. zg254]
MTSGIDDGGTLLMQRIRLPQIIGELETLANELAECQADAWDREDAAQLYADLERCRKKMGLADVAFINGNEANLPDTRTKRRNAMVKDFGLNSAEAMQRVVAAERLDNRPIRPDSDEPRRKFMPALREAVRDGAAHCGAVADVGIAIEKSPRAVHDLLTKISDEPLAQAIRSSGPAVTKGIATRLKQLLHAHGMEADYNEKDTQRKRGLTLSDAGADGLSTLKGTITPRCAAVLRKLWADYAKAGDLCDAQGSDGAELTSDQRAKQDRRNPSQRRHDALEAALFGGFSREEQHEFLKELQLSGLLSDGELSGGQWSGDQLSGGELPSGEQSGAGKPEEGEEAPSPELKPRRMNPARGATTIVATMTLDQLLSRTGMGMTDTGTLMPVNQLIEAALAQDVYLQVLDLNARTLWLGRSSRLGSLDQYLALFGEEGGSTAPGSDTPAAWCHIHHIQGWEYGGTTDIDNLTLVDPRNHAHVDDARRNPGRWWTYVGDATGPDKVVWIPPQSEDPERTPVTNDNPSVWGNHGPLLRREARRDEADA